MLSVVGTAGILAALSGITPGPVLSVIDRVLAAVAVVGAATVASGFARHASRTIAWLAVAGLVTAIEVGLHPTTAGPVLDVPWRWIAVVLLAAATAAVSDHTSRIRRRHHKASNG